MKVTIKIDEIEPYLVPLRKSGLYGKSNSEVCKNLIRQKIESLLNSGSFKLIMSVHKKETKC